MPRYSSTVIEKLTATPSTPKPNQFYLVESGGVTDLYLSDSKATLIPLTGAVASITIGSPITGSTTGSVLYANSSGHLAQDNPGLTYDPVTNALTVAGNLTANSFIKSGGTSAQFLKADGSVDSSVYLTGNETITLTGNVVGSGTTSIATTISNNVVTNAMLATVATATFKGRTTSGTGNVEDLTATQATALLNVFTSSLQGLVPASGGGTLNFLRADGTWAPPPTGSGSVVGSDPLWDAKGDLAVGTANDAASRLPVGANDTFLIADSSQTVGIKWAGGSTARTALGLGTIATQDASNVAITGGSIITDAGLAIKVPSTSNNLTLAATTSSITADRTLTFNVNDASRLISLSGNLTVSSAATISGTNTGDQTITLTGDVTGSGTGSFATTLATVNSNVGTFNGITVNAKGLVTAASTVTSVVYTENGNLSTSYAIKLLRNTDTSPTGFLILGRDAVDSATLFSVSALGDVTANSFIKSGGTSSQFLKADGSIDSNTYITGNQTITLSGDVSGSGTTAITTTIGANKVTLGMMATVATGTVFYRKTSGTGNPEVQTLATLKTDLGLTGTNSGDQTITLTGDVTGSGTGSFATTLATVNSNIGTFNNVTVNAKGLVTAASNVSYLTAESDTLASVTGRGNTSSTGLDLTENGNTSTSYALRLTRNTDSSPAGYYIQARNAAANSNLFILDVAGNVTATSFIKTGGTSSQFLKADGSVDSSTYLTGNQTITLSGDVTGSGATSISTTIANSAVTLAKMANVATSTVFYRKTSGTGAPEVQTLATLKTDLGLTGTNSGDQTITLTGDVTGSGTGSFATTLATVNSNVGTFNNVTVNAKGLVTAASNVSYLTSESDTLSSVTGRGNTSSSGLDLTENGNTSTSYAVRLTRNTDTSSVGFFIQARNAAANTNLFTVDTAGNATAASFVKSGGTSSQFLKADGSVDSSTYLTGNQTITLSGDVSGSGATAITTTIGAGKVTLAMMANLAANSIIGNNTGSPATPIALTTSQVKTLLALNNVENTALSTWAGSTNLVTLGTVTTGTWSATAIAATKGGTGFTTYTLGDILYSDATNSLAKLAGNTTSTRKFLRQTGTGSVSAAPAWDTVTNTDVGLGNVVNVDQTNASNLTSGTVGTARLGSGTANNTTYLRGDQTWQTISVVETDTLATVTGRGNTSSTGLDLTENGNTSTSYALRLTRNTDSTPTGFFIQARNAAANTNLFTVDVSGNATANSFVKSGGTSSQFLKADGSIDSSTYITGNQTITLSGDVSGSGTTAITTTIGANKVTLGMLATLSANSVIGNSTGSTATPTAVSMTTTASPSALILRDANVNAFANNFLSGYTSTATAAGTTTLTVSTTRTQVFTGSTTQTVVLPAVSSLALGHTFEIINQSSGNVTVQSSGANNIQVMAANSRLIVVSNATTGTGASVWYATYIPILTNVENTALSTWAGSSNLVTLGTVTTGTWNATTISTAKGGTGLGAYTLGDILYSDATNSLARLAGNTTTTRKFLRQVGNGSVSAAPAWDTVTNTDVGLGNVVNVDQTNASNLTSGTVGTARLGSGTANSTTYLRGDQTWATLPSDTDTLAIVTGRGNTTSTGLDLTENGNTSTSYAVRLTRNTDSSSVGFFIQARNAAANTNLFTVDVAGNATAASFVKTSGTSSQFLKADGSVDSNTYLTGNQTITLSGDVSGSGTTAITTTIGANKVTLGMMATVATSTVFYRKTAGTGNPEVQTLATLKTDLGLTGTNSGDQTITLTGDVTGSGTGSFATTLATVNSNTGTFAGLTVNGKGLVTAAVTNASFTQAANTSTAAAVKLLRNTDTSSVGFLIYGRNAADNTTLFSVDTAGNTTANSFVKSGGTSSQFLKADGSVDSSTYLTGNQTITLSGDVTGSGATSISTTIASGAVSLAKMANLAANSIIGNNTGSPATPIALTTSQVKTLLSLNNVENTALSTWAGSTNLTTLGTITSGTWSATAIGPTKGGTGLTTYTLGDTIYSDASNSLAKLAGNTTSTKKFLTQTGTGSVSAAPAWGTIATGDLGTGSATSSTFLRGDLTWAAPTVAWGNITGTLSAQTDLNTALNAKVNKGSTFYLSDYASLAAAISAIGSTVADLIVDTAMTTAGTTTFPQTTRLSFEGAGKITVGSGHTLTIGLMRDAGNKQVIVLTDGTSVLRFSVGAVPHMNVAWIVGPNGGTATNAITQFLATCSANSGGVIYVPSGTYTTTGAHALTSHTIIRGDGFSTPGANSTIRLSSASTNLFTLGDGIATVQFRDIGLDGNSLSSTVGINCNGSSASGGGLSLINTYVRAFTDGLKIKGTVLDWQMAQVLVDNDCVFEACSHAAVYYGTINSDMTFGANVYGAVGGYGFYIERSGPINITGSEFAGAGTYGAMQTIKQTISGNITVAGTATVTVTAAGMTGSPHVVSVPLTTSENTSAKIAEKIRVALHNDLYIRTFFHVVKSTGTSDADVVLIAIDAAANDATMNMAVNTGTATGLTNSSTSTTVASGSAHSLADTVFYVTGQHGEITLTEYQDEQWANSIQCLTGTDLASVWTIIGSTLQSPIKMTTSTRINAIGCSFTAKGFRDSGGGNQLTAIGNTVSPFIFVHTGVGGGTVTTYSVYQDIDAFSTILGFSAKPFEVDVENSQLRSQYPNKIFRNSLFFANPNPWLEILSYDDAGGAFRVGRCNDGGIADLYYDFYRNNSNGRLMIQGNQSGFTGIDTNGPLYSTGLVSSGAVSGTSATFSSATFTGGISGTSGSFSSTLDALTGTFLYTGGNQLRVGYNSSNYINASVDSSGNTTFTLAGSSPTLTFSTYTQLNAGVGSTWIPYIDGNIYLSAANTIFRDASNVELGRVDNKANINLRLCRRTNAVAGGGTQTPNIDNYNYYVYYAVPSSMTIANPTGTPNGHGEELIFRINDDGAAGRSLTWGSAYRALSTALPTTTVPNKALYVMFLYNAENSKWDCILINQQA